MTITTTPTIEGKRIRDYRGIVTGEAILAPIFSGICLQACATLWAGARRLMRRNFGMRGKWRWRRWRRPRRI